MGKTSGYSGIPLSKKLGFKKGMLIHLIHAPDNYLKITDDLGEAIAAKKDNMGPFDLIHLFTNSLEELETRIPRLKQQIKKDGMIWVSWYKKTSGQFSELTEDRIREMAIYHGLVDVKVCAVDE